MEDDDPWSWDTERIVQEFCSIQRSWPDKSPSQRLPDPVKFAEALRSHEIDGPTLLTEINSLTLRDDLGVVVLAQRGTVRWAISHFRERSLSYQASLLRCNSSERLGSVRPYHDEHGSRPLDWVPERESRGVNISTSENLGSKRRRLRLAYPGDDIAPLFDDSPSAHDEVLTSIEHMPGERDRPIQTQNDGATNTKSSHDVEDSGVPLGKRKRIAPTLISTTIDLNRVRSIPTEADSVRLYDPNKVESGNVYKGDDGKKRLMLIPPSNFDLRKQDRRIDSRNSTDFSRPNTETFPASGAKTSIDSRNKVQDQQPLRPSYLGKSKMSVDDTFYSDPVGASLPTIEEGQEIAHVSKPIPFGRQLYVHGIMKRYLLAVPQVNRRDGKSSTALRPYAKRLAPMDHSPSFTLFRIIENGRVHATREYLSNWPEFDPERVAENLERMKNVDERQAQFELPDNLPLGGPNSYSEWDPSMLEKYRYIDGGDVVLPLYGDSDAEDAVYDEDTMKEIEEEHGTPRVVQRRSKRPGLSDDEVNKAIDDGITELVAKWKLEKLPRRQPKAWKIWHKAKKENSKRRQIREAHRKLDRLNNERIPKIRQSILDEHWATHKQVRRMTRIMELSIFDREDLLWQISTLESSAPPEKPQHIEVPVKTHRLARLDEVVANDEGESIESDSSYQSSDDGLMDFIVSDDAEQPLEDMPGHEIEDTDTDTSDDADIPARPVKTGKTIETGLRNRFQSSTTAQPDEQNEMVSLDTDGDYSTTEANNFEQPWPVLSEVHIKVDSDMIQSNEVATRPPSVIDLTVLLSSDASAGEEVPLSPQLNRSKTPETLYKVPFQGSSRPHIKLIVKRSSSPGRFPEESKKPGPEPVVISDSDEVIQLPSFIPPLRDFKAIAAFPLDTWTKRQDRDRLLISLLLKATPEVRTSMLQLFTDLSEEQLWFGMIEVMSALRDGQNKVRGVDPNTFRCQTSAIKLFQSYISCRNCKLQSRLPPELVESFKAEEHMFKAFHRLCLRVLLSADNKSNHDILSQSELKSSTPIDQTGAVEALNDSDDDEPLSATRRQSSNQSGSEEIEHNTPHKFRKRKVLENAEARDRREQEQQRVREQEARRKILQQKLSRSVADLDVDPARIIINEAKLEEQGFIYVNDQIARRIKKHQIEGVRFMWDQVITNSTPQGCLLAHTMGLGKTMQIITLLTAIAEAADSADPTVSSQIPRALRWSKTLVLCPPTLIDNWMDELLTWAPVDVLGKIDKIDSTVKKPQRQQILYEFSQEGGILILGYEMFRLMVENKATTAHAKQLSDSEHEEILTYLLKGPNIIVADEAHKMKNAGSGLTIAANKFRSMTRIALTGSPLANNVEEYHTMIEWVAPGYLGPIVEFRSKYVEPIQQGLYSDSTSYERRKSLKMLGVLKEDLTPKVHRADMSVLRNDLKPKTEFVITVPLTTLQTQAYIIYVRSMLNSPATSTSELTKAGKLQQTTIWHWLAILSLLCNHPECFWLKLKERKDDARRASGLVDANSDEEPTADESSVPIWKVGVSDDVVRQEMKLFDDFISGSYTVEAIENSNKVAILNQILDESRTIGDKVLIFSQSLPTLNYLERFCRRTGRKYCRLDGRTTMGKRQALTKKFNTGDYDLCLISTTAGGLGLNLPGANRVIIFDFKYNPINEEQAIGRAYRIGQQKPVYVYRFVAGGTFEDGMHNKAVFKMQLASRVVDKKNPVAWAKKKVGDFLFEPRQVEQQDLSDFRGMDPLVLDKILDQQTEKPTIRAIVMTDTFQRHDDDELTVEELREVKQLLSDEQLKRSNPKAWQELQERRVREEYQKRMEFLGPTTGMSLQAAFNPNLPNVLPEYAPSSSIHLPSYPTGSIGPAQPLALPSRTSLSIASSTIMPDNIAVVLSHQSSESLQLGDGNSSRQAGPELIPIPSSNTKVLDGVPSIDEPHRPVSAPKPLTEVPTPETTLLPLPKQETRPVESMPFSSSHAVQIAPTISPPPTHKYGPDVEAAKTQAPDLYMASQLIVPQTLSKPKANRPVGISSPSEQKFPTARLLFTPRNGASSVSSSKNGITDSNTDRDTSSPTVSQMPTDLAVEIAPPHESNGEKQPLASIPSISGPLPFIKRTPGGRIPHSKDQSFDSTAQNNRGSSQLEGSTDTPLSRSRARLVSRPSFHKPSLRNRQAAEDIAYLEKARERREAAVESSVNLTTSALLEVEKLKPRTKDQLPSPRGR